MPAACLAVVWCQVTWLTYSQPSALPSMATTLRHFEAVLAPLPHLLPPVLDALNEDREVDTTFFLDPVVMQLAQSYGRGNVLGPLYQVCRTWVWSAHPGSWAWRHSSCDNK